MTGDLDVQSSQTLSGDVAAQTTINVATDAGQTLQSTTAATGNSGSSIILGGGTLTGSFNQTTTSAAVDAESQLNGANAQTGDASFSVQAIANSQLLGSTDSAIAANINQSNAATVTANGGVVFGDVAGQGAFAAAGVANNVMSTGQGASTQGVVVNQTNNGEVTQGAMFANLGQSGVTSTSATASGDNANITNTEGSLTVGATQDNEAYVRAQSVETSFNWGAASVEAEGVGNSVAAGAAGPSLSLDNVQLNGVGGVQSIASFGGDTGFDTFVSSSATGNAVTGFACSQCGGVVSVENSQTNLGDVSASSAIDLTGAARSVRGVATAVGNTASFYVSTPH